MSETAAGPPPAWNQRSCVDMLGHPTTVFVIVLIFVIVLLRSGQQLDAISTLVITLLLAVTGALRPAVRPPAGRVFG